MVRRVDGINSVDGLTFQSVSYPSSSARKGLTKLSSWIRTKPLFNPLTYFSPNLAANLSASYSNVLVIAFVAKLRTALRGEKRFAARSKEMILGPVDV